MKSCTRGASVSYPIALCATILPRTWSIFYDVPTRYAKDMGSRHGKTPKTIIQGWHAPLPISGNSWESVEMEAKWTNIHRESDWGSPVPNQLGWKAAIMGFWSEHWVKTQQSYYQFRRWKNTGEAWMGKVIRGVWTLAREMWNTRNRYLHAKNREDKYHCTEDLDNNKRAEFCKTIPTNIPTDVRPLFYHRSLQKTLTLSNYERRQWLVVV